MTTLTEQQSRALACFVSCVVEDLNPSLQANSQPHNGEAEYVVLLGRRGVAGLIHEDLEAVLRIATEHGGPDPEGEHDAQAAKGRAKPRASA